MWVSYEQLGFKMPADGAPREGLQGVFLAHVPIFEGPVGFCAVLRRPVWSAATRPSVLSPPRPGGGSAKSVHKVLLHFSAGRDPCHPGGAFVPVADWKQQVIGER